MRLIAFVFLSFIAIHVFAQSEDNKRSEPVLMNRTDSLNYFFGLTLGYSLETAPFTPDAQVISQGLKASLEGTSEFDQEVAKDIFQALHLAMSQEEDSHLSPDEIDNREKGIAFLNENNKKDGVYTTVSGLQYKVLTMGDGAKPAATDTVKVHYRGTLLDGTEFDSSYARNEPISFALNRVIAGWTEGVQLMPIGSKFEFYIAPELGYGEGGGGPIPPNSTLIFEVELLDIEK